MPRTENALHRTVLRASCPRVDESTWQWMTVPALGGSPVNTDRDVDIRPLNGEQVVSPGPVHHSHVDHMASSALIRPQTPSPIRVNGHITRPHGHTATKGKAPHMSKKVREDGVVIARWDDIEVFGPYGWSFRVLTWTSKHDFENQLGSRAMIKIHSRIEADESTGTGRSVVGDIHFVDDIKDEDIMRGFTWTDPLVVDLLWDKSGCEVICRVVRDYRVSKQLLLAPLLPVEMEVEYKFRDRDPEDWMLNGEKYEFAPTADEFWSQ